jgi:hypothetical protein
MADGRHGDAGAEVDQLVAVHVDEDGPVPTVDVEVVADAHRRRHGRLAAFRQRPGCGPGQLSEQEPLLGEGLLVHRSSIPHAEL